MMFKTMLVPLDGTSESNAVLPFAVVLARRCGARLVLLRVVDQPRPNVDQRESGPGAVPDDLRHIAEEVYQSGVEAEVRVSTGDVVSEVVRVADLEHADALVMATHSGLLDRMIDNSTACQLIARIQLPVFVVRPGGPTVAAIRSLVVAVDGSPGAAQALDEAASLARATGATLALVRVIPMPAHFAFDPLVASALGGPPDGDGDAQAFAVAKSYVNEVAHRLAAHGVTATAKVMLGLPAEQIVAAARQLEADVIVMSTRAHGGALRTVLGSTADAVVHAAGRPVLLVRQMDGAAAAAAGHMPSADTQRRAQSVT